jgi:hypothetical protein
VLRVGGQIAEVFGALTPLSLMRLRKRKSQTDLTIILFLTVFPLFFGGGGKFTFCSGMNISPARIAFELFLFLEKSPDEVFAFIS